MVRTDESRVRRLYKIEARHRVEESTPTVRLRERLGSCDIFIAVFYRSGYPVRVRLHAAKELLMVGRILHFYLSMNHTACDC